MSVQQKTPPEAWEGLSSSRAVLVDVRTQPEWGFVGIPDLSSLGAQPLLIEWRRFPGMSMNESFLEGLDSALAKACGDQDPEAVYFLCRSGARSNEAAFTASMHFRAAGREIACINVAEGFEGDVGPDGHRGTVNGWKAHGLPWRQS